jgi:flagellar hook-associated protein 2
MATSSISLGSVVTSGGTTRLSGTSSELDTEALVEALVSAKKVPAVRLESRIKTNEAKLAALQDLKTILSDLRTSVSGLRSPPGVLGTDANLFEKKEAYLSANTSAAPNGIIGVAASNRAQSGTFQLVVHQLATAQKLTSASVNSLNQKLEDKFAAFGGTLTLGLSGGATADIAIDGTMTIQDVRSAINAQSAKTGVTATVLQVGSNDVRLVLSASETGKAITLANGTGNDVLAKLGLSADGGATVQNPVQVAQSARFSLDGVMLERSSNKVEDALQGMTLNLFRSDPGTTVTVEVERSLGAVKDSINSLVEAYNKFRDFIDQQNKLSSDGEVSSDSPLFANAFLRDIQTNVSSLLGGAATGGGSLGEIGISFDASNKMQVDANKLDNALLTKLDRVRDIFEFRYQTSSTDLIVSKHADTIGDTSFAISIVDADSDGQIESASIDGVAVDVDKGFIKGRAGTAYAGLEFNWIGKGSTTISVEASQGIADQTYNALAKALDETEGRMASEVGGGTHQEI